MAETGNPKSYRASIDASHMRDRGILNPFASKLPGTFKHLGRCHLHPPKKEQQMAINDPRQSPPRGPYVQEKSNAPMIGGAIALAVVLGVGFWFMNHRSAPVAANPPTATHAPATGVAVPRLDETTGQAAPRGQ